MHATGLALMGGTFDPIHFGHLIAGRAVREALGLEELIFIPSAQPPHKSKAPISDAPRRLAMVGLAIEGDRGFACDDCEAQRAGPSYSYDTVMEFRRQLGTAARICWIIGADSLAELESWHRIGDLLDACEIITVRRPGWNASELPRPTETLNAEQIAKLKRGIMQTPRIDISATGIRRRVACGMPIRYLVPEAVRGYIEEHQLYRDARAAG